MARYLPVNDIINRAAVEAGLLPSNDPVTDTDETYIQMVGLLNSCGQELCELNDWPTLTISLTRQAGIEQTKLLWAGLYPRKIGHI